MKPNAFNICSTCIHKDLCVLTTKKSQVWSCSEYDEGAAETRADLPEIKQAPNEREMAMALHYKKKKYVF